MHDRIGNSLPQDVLRYLQHVLGQCPPDDSAPTQVAGHRGDGVVHHERHGSVTGLAVDKTHAVLLGLGGAGVHAHIHDETGELLLRVGCQGHVPGEGGDAVAREDIEPLKGRDLVALVNTVENVRPAGAQLGQETIHAPGVKILKRGACDGAAVRCVLDPAAHERVHLVGRQADVVTASLYTVRPSLYTVTTSLCRVRSLFYRVRSSSCALRRRSHPLTGWLGQ